MIHPQLLNLCVTCIFICPTSRDYAGLTTLKDDQFEPEEYSKFVSFRYKCKWQFGNFKHASIGIKCLITLTRQNLRERKEIQTRPSLKVNLFLYKYIFLLLLLLLLLSSLSLFLITSLSYVGEKVSHLSCCEKQEVSVTESTSHLLWECPMARNVWAISKGRVQKCSNQVQGFFQLFRMSKGKLTKTELERWATTSWAIWNARNKYYFEKVQMQPKSIMDHATVILEDYQRLAASQNTIAVVP